MSVEANLKLLTLAGIAHRCAQETDRFFRRQSHDPHYCFELFRRAIVHQNERAWELVYDQYLPLVAGWVRRHSAFPGSDEEVQYFANRAFEKMWSAVSPEKFEHFENLKSLLGYLQMCVHSAVVDEVRSGELPTVDIEDEVLTSIGEMGGVSVAKQAVKRVQREEVWEYVNERLNDEKERLVIHASFVLALKPREIYADHTDMFEDVTEIYRIKQNVMARLRRDSELKEFIGADA